MLHTIAEVQLHTNRFRRRHGSHGQGGRVRCLALAKQNELSIAAIEHSAIEQRVDALLSHQPGTQGEQWNVGPLREAERALERSFARTLTRQAAR